MNVLLATDASLERGGITLFMLQWIKGIKEIYKYSNIHAYFRDRVEDSFLEKEFKELGVRIHTGNISRSIKFKNIRARKKVIDDISDIINKNSIDVIHIHSGVFGYNLDLLRVAKRLGIHIRISHSHGAYPERLRDKVIHRFMIMWIKKYATTFAGCSVKAGNYLFGEKGVSSDKWIFVPNTIQSDRFLFNYHKRIEGRNDLRINDTELLLGAVGHLNSGKNHLFLLEVLSLLLQNNRNSAKLVIFGKGNMKNKLIKKMIELHLEDKVILYGTTDDVPKWLSAMDVFLMPSESEGLGISAVEAQASGLPCILSDRFPKEVIINNNVWCLPIDKGPDEWVEVIEKIDFQLCGVRENGVKMVKQAGFDKTNTKNYVKALYEQKQRSKKTR